MSLVTRIYEVAITIDQSFLDGPIDDDDEIERRMTAQEPEINDAAEEVAQLEPTQTHEPF